MSINHEKNHEQTPGTAASARRQADDPYATAEFTLRCIQCNAPVPGALCVRKTPCASCGYPYPLGDCSDLAEN
jgi:hypothetical protein